MGEPLASCCRSCATRAIAAAFIVFRSVSWPMTSASALWLPLTENVPSAFSVMLLNPGI